MKILLLSTWFPYPLSQGSKIRAYHLLKLLASRHQVKLISFADIPLQPIWIEHVEQFCEVSVVDRDPFYYQPNQAILRQFSLRPKSAVATYSQEMEATVRKCADQWKPDCVVALTFVTAPYALKVKNVIKVVDVDNLLTQMLYEEFQNTQRLKTRLRKWLAWWKFKRYERWLFEQFDLCLVVSARDKELLASFSQISPEQISIISNGVDTDHNQPGLAIPTPNTLIFNGALTYFANLDAMNYFLQEIFPLITKDVPDVQLSVTGKKPKAHLPQLYYNGNVFLTGYLDDIRPAVASHWACVVPLRIGAGTRLKILEAMALGTPVVTTSKGAEGLDVTSEKDVLIADTPIEFADTVVRILRQPDLREKLTRNARRLVEQLYSWNTIGQQLCQFIETQTEQEKTRSKLLRSENA